MPLRHCWSLSCHCDTAGHCHATETLLVTVMPLRHCWSLSCHWDTAGHCHATETLLVTLMPLDTALYPSHFYLHLSVLPSFSQFTPFSLIIYIHPSFPLVSSLPVLELFHPLRICPTARCFLCRSCLPASASLSLSLNCLYTHNVVSYSGVPVLTLSVTTTHTLCHYNAHSVSLQPTLSVTTTHTMSHYNPHSVSVQPTLCVTTTHTLCHYNPHSV